MAQETNLSLFANNVNTSGLLELGSGVTGTLPSARLTGTYDISISGNAATATLATTATDVTNGLGSGQTWQDVSASRASGTTYTNSTGKPILVNIIMGTTTNTTNSSLTVGGVVVSRFSQDDNYTQRSTLSAIVPNGATYALTSGGAPIVNWVELR